MAVICWCWPKWRHQIFFDAHYRYQHPRCQPIEDPLKTYRGAAIANGILNPAKLLPWPTLILNFDFSFVCVESTGTLAISSGTRTFSVIWFIVMAAIWRFFHSFVLVSFLQFRCTTNENEIKFYAPTMFSFRAIQRLASYNILLLVLYKISRHSQLSMTWNCMFQILESF